MKLSERKLSPRDNDILRELVDGKSNRGIAIALGLAEGTVKVYISHLRQAQFRGMNRVEIALWAERHRTAGRYE